MPQALIALRAICRRPQLHAHHIDKQESDSGIEQGLAKILPNAKRRPDHRCGSEYEQGDLERSHGLFSDSVGPILARMLDLEADECNRHPPRGLRSLPGASALIRDPGTYGQSHVACTGTLEREKGPIFCF
jgi:hypothetical protein